MDNKHTIKIQYTNAKIEHIQEASILKYKLISSSKWEGRFPRGDEKEA